MKIPDLKIVLIVVTGLAFVTALVLTPWYFFLAPTEPDEYEYTVKTQQAFDVSRVSDDDVTAFDNLSSDEQDVLFDAFKKSDHFMGTSSETVYYDTEHDTFEGWRNIEMNGVVFVLAVNEDVHYQSVAKTLLGEVMMGAYLFSITWSMIVLLFLFLLGP